MKKILIADDDEDIRGITRELLQTDGYEVLEASDGQEAFDKVVNYRPDLVLLDIMMPEIHGFSVCQKIKTDAALKGTRVVIFSVKSYSADRLQAKQVGADDFISKPMDMGLFKELIHLNLSA